MSDEQSKLWISFKKRLNSLPCPYRTAFEMFILKIGKIAPEDNLQSVSNEILSNAKKEYFETHNTKWKGMLEDYKRRYGIEVPKDDLKRYMTRPTKNGEHLEFFSKFFNLDKNYIVYGIKKYERYDYFLGKKLTYIVCENSENAKRLDRQQDIKPRFLSLDEKTQKALIQLVETISALLSSEK